MNENKIVIFSGAGISAESGIDTYRDSDGLWETFDPKKVASLTAWQSTPEVVCEYFNDRLKAIEAAQPNPAHLSLVKLEKKFEVIIITQNVDDLHERAGSSQVIHLHGKSTQLRTEPDDNSEPTIYERGFAPMDLNETDENGFRLRPNIVLFGEPIQFYDEAKAHIKQAGKVLAVGTSLQVEPAAGLLKQAHYCAEKVLIAREIIESPRRFQIQRGSAGHLVPILVKEWLR